MTKEKSQAELEIEALADVFGIATTGFEKFAKEAKENSSSGNYSTAASSGDSSTAASSGYSSKAASSGNYSTAASSGDYSKAASSGDYSKAASSGNYSTAASSGYSSKAASSGDYSKAESSGEHSACASVGYRAAVKGDKGNLLMASEYIKKDDKLIPIGGKADIVDGKKLKAGSWYIVENGAWQEVDFSDGIFSRVISNKAGVKKVKTEDGKVLYVVGDENGNFAHGETIKEAREDLVYKAIAKFDGKMPAKTTVKEWIGLYRAVTGACGAGVRGFCEKTFESLDDEYTAKQIVKLVQGQYGADKFAAAVNKKAA
jgi:hypothetical protein